MNLSEKHKALAVECGAMCDIKSILDCDGEAIIIFPDELALYTSKIQAEVLQSLKEQEPVMFVSPRVVENSIRGVRYGATSTSPRLDEEDGHTIPLYAQPIPAKE